MTSFFRFICYAAMAGSLTQCFASGAFGGDLQGNSKIAAPQGELKAGDAYVRSGGDGKTWTIGNGAMEQVFAAHDGQFRLVSYKNKLTNPSMEYVSEATAGAPFALDADAYAGRYKLEELWGETLGAGITFDFVDKTNKEPTTGTKQTVTFSVKKGDLIGFSAGSLAPNDYRDEIPCGLEWPTVLQYADGKRYSSVDDQKMDQGPMWYYYLHGTGTGHIDGLDEMIGASDAILPMTDYKEKQRGAVGYRAPWETPNLGTSFFGFKNAFNVIRAWRAPADGKVTLGGKAKALSGCPIRLQVVKIKERAGQVAQRAAGEDAWRLEKGSSREINAGGRPAVQLDLTLSRENLRAQLHIIAYPGASVMRQWWELENTGSSKQTLQSPAPLALALNGDDATSMTRYWMRGGTARTGFMDLKSTTVKDSYHEGFLGEKNDNYFAWTALQRHSGARDGCYISMDYLGVWVGSVDHDPKGALHVSMALPSLVGRELAPGERLEMPRVTLGVFHKDLDDMGQRVYDWQYQYMWDFTNPDYYAQPLWAVPFFCQSKNLQEQFTARLAKLDMDSDMMRSVGFTLLWDDAGWAKYPDKWPIPDHDLFQPTHEGPDFSQTLDYLKKMDMKWLAWFAGVPTLGPMDPNLKYRYGYSQGLMNSKAGAWGDFQWRTDGVGRFSFAGDKILRKRIEQFLTLHRGASYHTCDGGGRFAHDFDIQRLSDTSMLSDIGCGPEANYYFSYLDTPDKWNHLWEAQFAPAIAYRPALSRFSLNMVPSTGFQATPEEQEYLRRDIEIYRFLTREGVAGRWSYVFHPAVKGDDKIYYFERTNHERTKACIIQRNKPAGEVTVWPKGLLPEHEYVVGFESKRDTTTRTGADLMANGVRIQPVVAGEIIYLGMPDRPGSGYDKSLPQAPGRVLLRREVNLGHTGVGVYWSTSPEDHWIKYYEVQRNGKMLGKVATGAYTFDWSPEADLGAVYSVRTVDGNDNASAWTNSSRVTMGEPFTAAVLGGHFAEWGRDGWQAETTTDFVTYKAMQFIPGPKRVVFGDSSQGPGGQEGYWEGAGTARVGRGWQQASTESACVRTWIAPRSGKVRVVGRAMKEYYRQDKGNALRVKILLNKKQVWPEGEWAEARVNDLAGSSHDVALKVKKGDALRFVLDRSENPELDIVAWMPQIIYSEKNRCGNHWTW